MKDSELKQMRIIFMNHSHSGSGDGSWSFFVALEPVPDLTALLCNEVKGQCVMPYIPLNLEHIISCHLSR